MTPEQELQLLIEEQRKDDTYRIASHVPSGFTEVRLDGRLPSGDSRAELIGVDEEGNIVSFLPRGDHPSSLSVCGTASAYGNRRCRCRRCTDAAAAHHREWYARTRKLPVQTRACGHCGELFEEQGRPTQVYCSPSCREGAYYIRRRKSLRFAQRQAVTA